MRAPLYLLSSIALSALLLPALARAEAPAPTPAPANGLGEIIVTAQHRSESLQKAAVSVTAVSGDLLRASASNSAAAAIANVAAVQIQGNTNGAQIYIRGVGSNADSQLGDPAVNLNVDGVYQQETEVPTSLIFDVNRVEVLRGPQGTLYGRNATAGAVNIVTTDPEPGKLGGYAMLQGGNYAAIHSEAALNLPISADWTARAAFASDKHDGYLSNGDDDANMVAARLKLLYKPAGPLKVLIAGDYLHQSGNDLSSVEAPLSAHPAWESDKPRGYLDLAAWNIRAQADYDAGFANITLLAAHNDYLKTESNVVLDPTAVAIHREGRQNSVELRLASPTSSRIKWVGGLFYLHDIEVRQVIPSRISTAAASASDPELRDATAQSFAAFANVTVPLADHIRLTGGIRYTHDEKGARFVYTDSSGDGDVRSSKAWNSVTYKGAIEADLGPRSLVYGQVSSGFKAGGYAQQFPAATYNPEKITAFEIGSKNRFWGNRLQVNLSAFDYQYSDYQAQYPDMVDGAFALVTTNAASARLYGAELETRLKASDHDSFSASVTALHARFGAFTYTSVLAGSVDHSYQNLPNAPHITVDLAYDHDFDLANGATLTAHVNTHISEGYWTTVERTTDSYQPAFTRTDAFLSYKPAGKHWDLRAFVRNLENTPVRTLGASNPFDTVLLLAAPRTYGAAATLRF